VVDAAVEAPGAGSSLRRARLWLSAVFWQRTWLRVLLLLAPPVLAFLVVYVGALGALFISAFWEVDAFTGKIVHSWTLKNFSDILHTGGTYLRIAGRTIGIAGAVTLTDALLAFPLAYYMARIAKPRTRTLLMVAILLPLWSSYLVRIYAWRTILGHDGALNWTLNKVGIGDVGLLYTNWGMWIVFSYIWLPFMVIPVYAALERIPDNFLEASADLGARGWRTFRSVMLPLVLPGLVAGSIFTFSLTLGDFITPLLIGGGKNNFIGNIVESYIGINSNIPFAAAFATIPVLVMAGYLLLARRLGAFEAL
jgi:putative spermidine/putrescine transport system permease protein